MQLFFRYSKKTLGSPVFRFLWTLVLIITISSCVTNRKYQLVQKNDVNKSNLRTDSVMREYKTVQFEYRLQTNDIVSIRFESLTPKEYDFLSIQTGATNPNLVAGGGLLFGDLIDDRGEIPFPVVGRTKVGGLTVFEAQNFLQGLANQYLESPTVKVRLLNYRATFLGEVHREGVILMQNNRVSMLEALGLAGGLTDLADKTNIKLIRQKGDKTEIIYINLQDENFITSPYYYVYQNDVIVAPPLKQRPYQRYFSANISVLLSAITLLIIVLTYTK